MDSAADFSDACVKTGRPFVIYRIKLKDTEELGSCVFMMDRHATAPKLHDLIRAAISIAEADGTMQVDGEDVRKTLIGGEQS
jgi:hypothetical protein